MSKRTSYIYRLFLNPSLEIGIHSGTVSYYVHLGLENLLQFFLHMDHREKIGRVHLNNDIDVTPLSGAVSRDRAKDAYALYAMLCRLGLYTLSTSSKYSIGPRPFSKQTSSQATVERDRVSCPCFSLPPVRHDVKVISMRWRRVTRSLSRWVPLSRRAIRQDVPPTTRSRVPASVLSRAMGSANHAPGCRWEETRQAGHTRDGWTQVADVEGTTNPVTNYRIIRIYINNTSHQGDAFERMPCGTVGVVRRMPLHYHVKARPPDASSQPLGGCSDRSWSSSPRPKTQSWNESATRLDTRR